MSEYTPSTDEVRSSTDEVRSNTVMRDGKSYEVSFAEFNRWLAAHDAEVERAAAAKALTDAADGKVPGELSKNDRRVVEAWLRECASTYRREETK